MADSAEQLEFRKRVIEQYLPAFCSSYDPPAGPFNPSNFVTKNEWAFPTPGVAHWFLAAVDEGVVEAKDGGILLGKSWPDGIFDRGASKDLPPRDRPIKLREESILEVGAVGMLAIRYGWPAERLTFQPHPSLDFCAYAHDGWSEDDGRSEIAIGGEAKLSQPEAEELAQNIKVCGALGDHKEAECWQLRNIPEVKNRNHHRKYQGLVTLYPRIFWIVGPKAFTADAPDLVFAAEHDSGGIVRLTRTGANALMFPG